MTGVDRASVVLGVGKWRKSTMEGQLRERNHRQDLRDVGGFGRSRQLGG